MNLIDMYIYIYIHGKYTSKYIQKGIKHLTRLDLSLKEIENLSLKENWTSTFEENQHQIVKEVGNSNFQAKLEIEV